MDIMTLSVALSALTISSLVSLYAIFSLISIHKQNKLEAEYREFTNSNLFSGEDNE
jgi:hypothetical protein